MAKKTQPEATGGPQTRSAQQVEQIPVSDLIPYARNARTHSEQQVAQIAGSIQEFGFCNPVLIDGQNSIIAGHGRVLAAQRLKLNTVPCIRLTHLSDAQRRAYILADNRIALNSGWDTEMLANELSDLHADDLDLGLLGFDADELEELLNLGLDPAEPEQAEVKHEAPKHDGLDPTYGNATIRQIILVFDLAQYTQVVEAFGAYAEQFALANNTEVVLHMLEANGYGTSQRDTTEA